MTPKLPFIVSITIEGYLVKDKTRDELEQDLNEAVWLGTQTITDNIYGAVTDYKARVEVVEEWKDGRYRGDYHD
jgi:hypothetical protein